ncbi:transposase [Solibacillus sp. FSL R5-0449]|uniref:transposase n=1 Tax=Solibacillus sp. FSL R5-0449 TaxID=2921639 RepID=UPI0030CC7037
MTQLNLNLNLEEIEAAILGSDIDNIIKFSVILILNQYMEHERDAYLQAEAYERNDTRVTQRNSVDDGNGCTGRFHTSRDKNRRGTHWPNGISIYYFYTNEAFGSA